MEIVNKKLDLVALAQSQDGEDTSSIWWVTLKALRRLGITGILRGNGMVIVLHGDPQAVIVRSSDMMVETFVYDARSVIAVGNGTARLSDYYEGKAFSVELYANRQSYNPIYGPMSGSAVELARRYLFSLRELIQQVNLPQLSQRLLQLET